MHVQHLQNVQILSGLINGLNCWLSNLSILISCIRNRDKSAELWCRRVSIKFCYNLLHNKAAPLSSPFTVKHPEKSYGHYLPKNPLCKPPPHIFFQREEKKSIEVIDHCLFSLLLMCISLCETGGGINALFVVPVFTSIHPWAVNHSHLFALAYWQVSVQSAERKTVQESIRSFDFNTFV